MGCARADGASDAAAGGGSVAWRRMTAADLDAVAAIADEIHAALRERPVVFAEKLRLFPEGCFALEQGGAIAGYAIAHPWRRDAIPALDAFLGALPAAPDCLFVHDVVVLPPARGRGAAGAIVATLCDLARVRGLAYLALVSVYGTHRLWQRHGFAVVDDPALAARLAPYGDTARYMRRGPEV